MAYSIVDNLLKCLDYQNSHEDSTSAMKDQIQTLKMDLRLLRTFLMCSACRYIEDSDSKSVLMQVEALVQNAESDFQSLYTKSINGNMPTHMASLLVSNALEKVNILKAEITQVYATVLIQNFSDSVFCDKFVVEFAGCLLENLKDLRECIAAYLPMNVESITLETKLIFLKNFLRFVAKLSVENEKFQDLLVHASDVISDAAHLSYRCFIGKSSETAECGISNDVISRLVRRIIPINCAIIHYYIPYQKNTLAVEELDAGFLDFLLDTLAELVNCKITLEDFSNYNSNGLLEDLMFLKSYLSDLPEQYPELVKLILIHIASIARNVAPSIFFLYTDGVKEEEAVRHSTTRLAFLQEEITLIKAEVHLMCLPGPRWMATLKDRIQILYEEAVFLQALLNAPDECHSLGCELNGLFTQGQATVSMVGSLIMSLSNKESNEDMLNKMELATSVFLERTRIMKKVARDIFGRGPSKFPKTNDLGFLNSFLGNLKELLLHKADLVPFPKHHIARVHDTLEYLKKNLWDVIKQNNELKNLKARVMQAAYEAEYAIDSFLVGDRNSWCSVAEMSDVVEQLKVIQAEFNDIDTSVKFETDCDVRGVSSCVLSRTNAPIIDDDDVVVGFDDVAENIIDGLTRGMTERDVISIVGMPGLGKTTLAKKVFNDEKVSNYFDQRAWCYVSEVYKRKELLLEILSQVLEDVDEATKMKDDADLAELLFRKLKRKRYLIVVDDLWDIRAWEDLQRSFPDDDNGSRIIITTRLQDLASQIETDTKPDNHPTPLRFFTVEESWELLRKKVFTTDCCPRNLKEPGIRIAKSCQGLPLAVTLVAGLLARTKKKEAWWKEVAESINSYIVDDEPNQCTIILELSYKHLPDHLKPCFLYFGEILEHHQIPIQKLIWLWIAEGFVPQTDGKNFEDIAEDYLKDLIGRSLVMATKKRSNGSVKVCHVHDLLREYCKRKAEEENFFELISNENTRTFHEDLDDVLDSIYSLNPEEPRTRHNQRRLCVYSRRERFVKSRSSGPQVRSLLFFGIKSTKIPYDISPTCIGFRLLRVLDFGSINVGNSFPRDIKLLVQLRYLALQGTMSSVPPTIFKLFYLETFILKALRSEVCLPYTIWTLPRLRHLHVDARATFGWDGYDGWNLIQLENLQTISTPALIYDKDHAMDPNEIMRRLPNLRKLRCISMDSKDCYHFPSLEFLSRLESLKILHYGQSLSSCNFNLPLNLKRLTLSKFRLPWSEISRIGRLPHLEVLKLLCRAFEGTQWDTRDGEFMKLKFLKLDSLNIEQWNFSSDCLSSLEHLVLQSCKKFEEFPSCLGDIPMLRSVELRWCSSSAVNSIISIQEEVLEYTGDEGFKVHVYPPELDSRSSPKDNSD